MSFEEQEDCVAVYLKEVATEVYNATTVKRRIFAAWRAAPQTGSLGA